MSPKENFYMLHSGLCKVLANPKRLEILDTLRKQEMTVNELINENGMTQANLSQHLAILRAREVVKTHREKNTIIYTISDFKILQAYDLIAEMLQEKASAQNEIIREAMSSVK